jgi:sugar phosphate isomerase/epimerase
MPKKIPVLLQMYTVRDDAQADLASTLATVAKLGYAGVELAGYAGKTAAEYKKLLDDNGLRAYSAHVGIDQVRDNPTQVIEDAKLFGFEYVIVPWTGSPYVDSFAGFQQVGTLLAEAAPVFAAAGLTLGYHNHAFEFEKSENGVNGFDALFAAGGDSVAVEMDTFWVKKGGFSPAEYLGKYSGRTPLIHVKDMDADGNFAPVGAGTIDYLGSLLPAAEAAGVKYYIVEQDSCQAPLTPLESIQISIENLKSWGVA